jgi:hypothetical protein
MLLLAEKNSVVSVCVMGAIIPLNQHPKISKSKTVKNFVKSADVWDATSTWKRVSSNSLKAVERTTVLRALTKILLQEKVANRRTVGSFVAGASGQLKAARNIIQTARVNPSVQNARTAFSRSKQLRMDLFRYANSIYTMALTLALGLKLLCSHVPC